VIIDPENPNLAQLLVAAQKLTPLLDQIAFVGGCVIGLLITDPGAAPIRATRDVDVIVEIGSYAEFTLLENHLRELGLRESRDIVCRWINADMILDLMPTDPSILGFSNRWYGAALENAQQIRIEQYEIRVITTAYFLATKLEAFHDRGKNEDQMSHDLEDIVTVIDGRVEIIKEISVAEVELRRYLRDQFQSLLASRDFLEVLPGHLLPDAASQGRVGIVIDRIKKLTIES